MQRWRRAWIVAGSACAVWLGALSRDASAQAAKAAGAPPAAAEQACLGRGTPRADEARCVARAEPAPPDLGLAPRALFALPRLAWRTTSQVLTLGTRIEDDYQVRRRTEDLFWNDERTFGVYPTVLFATGIGGNVGLTLVHRDLFEHGEGLRMRAAYGSADRQLYDVRLHSGGRWLRLQPWLRVAYQLDDRGRFFGIGNEDLVPSSAVTPPLDAQQQTPAVRTRYQSEEFHTSMGVLVELSRAWSLRLSELFRFRDLSTGAPVLDGTVWVDQVFAPASLVGLQPDLVDAYSEAALGWDSRAQGTADVPRALAGRGVRFDLWSGVQAELAAPHSAFGRVGFDLQPFIPLFGGDRVLRLRLRGSSALGPLDAIPFIDLPRLGGSLLLRGYDANRFRGRVTLVASAEYRYPIQEQFAAYLFVDVGRAWTGFDELSLASLADSRLGFGVGLQIYAQRSALVRAQLASSIDGGLFFHLKVNTTDDIDNDY